MFILTVRRSCFYVSFALVQDSKKLLGFPVGNLKLGRHNLRDIDVDGMITYKLGLEGVLGLYYPVTGLFLRIDEPAAIWKVFF